MFVEEKYLELSRGVRVLREWAILAVDGHLIVLVWAEGSFVGRFGTAGAAERWHHVQYEDGVRQRGFPLVCKTR